MQLESRSVSIVSSVGMEFACRLQVKQAREFKTIIPWRCFAVVRLKVTFTACVYTVGVRVCASVYVCVRIRARACTRLCACILCAMHVFVCDGVCVLMRVFASGNVLVRACACARAARVRLCVSVCVRACVRACVRDRSELYNDFAHK